MSYRIAICDDNETQLHSMRTLVSAWARRFDRSCEILCYLSAEAFLFAYDADRRFDILLLDIEMREVSGIELARRIRNDNHRAQIIFITSHFEFISEGYDVDALHYLTKPVPEDKLLSVLDKAAKRLNQEPPFVIISCEGQTVKLYESDILYAESFLHYITIHTKEKEYKIKENISAFEALLSEDFFRIHRSYLVSLKCIARISRTLVTLADGTGLPLARGKYDALNVAFIKRN